MSSIKKHIHTSKECNTSTVHHVKIYRNYDGEADEKEYEQAELFWWTLKCTETIIQKEVFKRKFTERNLHREIYRKEFTEGNLQKEIYRN